MTDRPTKDEMELFENMMNRVAKNERIMDDDPESGFEAVLRANRGKIFKDLGMPSTKSNVDLAQDYLELTQRERQVIAQPLLRSGQKMKNLHNGIFMRGSITFEDYDAKLRMMDDAPYKLDMKLH